MTSPFWVSFRISRIADGRSRLVLNADDPLIADLGRDTDLRKPAPILPIVGKALPQLAVERVGAQRVGSVQVT
jgi:hypothetical protein